MSKLLKRAALILPLLFIFGCTEVEKDDPRFRVDPELESIVETQGFNVPDAGEVDLVEEMAGYRNAYKAGLEKLVKFYTANGDSVKLSWAKRELASMNSIPHYKFIMPAIIADSGLKATDTIPEADALYAEALKLYEEAGALLVIVDENKMRLALSKFNELIGMYPTSNKIDDAAYKAGRIYDRFGDYIIAAVYYQRTFQWNKFTPFAARSRAAYILDKRLNQKDDALVLYQLAYQYEKQFPNNQKFAQQRIIELTESMEKLDNDPRSFPGDDVN